MPADPSFFDPYRHGFARVAVAVPRCKVADPQFNAAQTIALLRDAAQRQVAVVAFPELGLSAYSCEDLFHQRALQQACLAALADVLDASKGLAPVAIVGVPLVVDHLLFNCAVAICDGRILGVVPKTYLPNYGEFYEARQFVSGDSARVDEIELCGRRVPFGAELVFQARQLPLLRIAIEVCEDLWVPIPPSSYAALAGATLLVNLSASNITVGKADYRHRLVSLQSARCIAAYLYTSAGFGESTTDLAWDGEALVYEYGDRLAESPRFALESHLCVADVDLERVSRERMRQTSFGQSVARHRERLARFRTVAFDLSLPAPAARPLERRVDRFPFVPADPARRDERCAEVYRIQVHGLAKRLESTGIRKVVIGVSGGLDSTQALLVCARAMDLLGLPRTNILGYTMPGFATSGRTLDQARRLMASLGCEANEIDIRPSCLQMLRDLGHPFAQGEPVHDITFENVQAGERTSHLFRLANHRDAIVVGTGDLSELALGWCTYGVGDHMSHYNVNASVPKTLITHLIRWVAAHDAGEDERRVLQQIAATEISPELVPAKEGVASEDGDQGDQPAQKTEDVIGPYPLQDFNLYHALRSGETPSKIAYLSWCAWHDAAKGAWPDLPAHEKRAYGIAEIKKHLRTFVWRFYKTSQFKRSCLPNAPKVGSGGSLSPRGDWRAPSDSEATAWLADLDRVPDEAPKND
mgnify:CR=1 FL=1